MQQSNKTLLIQELLTRIRIDLEADLTIKKRLKPLKIFNAGDLLLNSLSPRERE